VKEVQNMTARSCILSIVGMALAGSLGIGITGASAQTIYVEPYVDPYPVVVAPGYAYVVRPPLVAPPPIVRERTIVVTRPAYVPAPAFGVPVPRYGYPADLGYVVGGW
jgi:hypothetical protein